MGGLTYVCVCVQVWIEFGRIKLPQGLHPNDLEEEWGKLILEMLDREKALRPAVERYAHTRPFIRPYSQQDACRTSRIPTISVSRS